MRERKRNTKNHFYIFYLNFNIWLRGMKRHNQFILILFNFSANHSGSKIHDLFCIDGAGVTILNLTDVIQLGFSKKEEVETIKQ